jgi:D-beta-D-heptose 7-phosphate kinase/D-beta-D-heptose 1-phosphate adenosyltransferase
MSTPAATLLENAARPRILLIGDVMLDRYVWGDVERISPEAPIPILRISRREHRLGGAGSVASMLATLGVETTLASVVGDDEEGRLVGKHLDDLGVNRLLVQTVTDRPTTVKERLLGRAQQRYPHQMMRVDQESNAPIQARVLNHLLAGIAAMIDGIDLILVSDYNKGVCQGDFFPRLIELAHRAGVPVVADPIKDADYHRYRGCTLITPNRAEAARATGLRIASPQDGMLAGRRLVELGVQSVVVTLDRDGMVLVGDSGKSQHFAAKPRQVCDITGAGDMVLATLGFLLAAGAEMGEAIETANVAGGLEVERLGVVPLTCSEILAGLSQAPVSGQKLLAAGDLDPLLARLRLSGKKIVMTNGCFDLLHPGHISSLEAARKQGDCLLVAVNSDRSVRALKGIGRPIIDAQGRAEMLAALACVDYVVVFDDVSVAGLVERIKPDVLVKADQYSVEQVVGHEVVLERGGHVVGVPTRPNYSTTEIIARIQQLPGERRHAA